MKNQRGTILWIAVAAILLGLAGISGAAAGANEETQHPLHHGR